MYTTVLAYVIAFLGFVMIGTGVWGLFYLQSGTRPILLRYCGMMIAMICGGFGLGVLHKVYACWSRLRTQYSRTEVCDRARQSWRPIPQRTMAAGSGIQYLWAALPISNGLSHKVTKQLLKRVPPVKIVQVAS